MVSSLRGNDIRIRRAESGALDGLAPGAPSFAKRGTDMTARRTSSREPRWWRSPRPHRQSAGKATAAGVEFDRRRAVEAQGPAGCLRLPHAHLRSRALRHASEQAGRPSNATRVALPLAAEADRDDARRRRPAAQLRIDNRVTVDAIAQLGPMREASPSSSDGHGRRAESVPRRRRARIRFTLGDPATAVVKST